MCALPPRACRDCYCPTTVLPFHHRHPNGGFASRSPVGRVLFWLLVLHLCLARRVLPSWLHSTCNLYIRVDLSVSPPSPTLAFDLSRELRWMRLPTLVGYYRTIPAVPAACVRMQRIRGWSCLFMSGQCVHSVATCTYSCGCVVSG